MRHEVPEFLRGEALDWSGRGYAILVPPGLDLNDPAAWRHPNAWIVFCAALHDAKSGRFDRLPALLDLIRSTDDDVIWSYSAQLLGDAAPGRIVRTFVRELESQLFSDQPVYQVALCRVFQQSMLLHGVPVMLEMYLRSTQRSQTRVIQTFLSELLEPTLGAIGASALPDDDYRRLVMKHHDDLAARLGSDDVPVRYGMKFSVERLARRMHDDLTGPQAPNRISMMLQRHCLEAMTGLDCSSFFKNRQLQPLAATAWLEKFLQGGQAAQYEDGVRYFHGRRIPD